MNSESNPKPVMPSQRNPVTDSDTQSTSQRSQGQASSTGNKNANAQGGSGHSDARPGNDVNKQSGGIANANQNSVDERQHRSGRGTGNEPSSTSGAKPGQASESQDSKSTGKDIELDTDDSDARHQSGQKKVDPATAPKADASGKNAQTGNNAGRSADQGQSKNNTTNR